MKILAISGSLRNASHNSALLRALARLSPTGIEVALFRELGDLPLFNPDIEDPSPAAVARLRTQLIAADAVVIASPEYAHGITGAMKNALDWMVGSEAFVDKPVALINASPRAVLAQAALKETITTMAAQVVEAACITLPILGSGLDEDGMLADPETATALKKLLHTLHTHVQQTPMALRD